MALRVIHTQLSQLLEDRRILHELGNGLFSHNVGDLVNRTHHRKIDRVVNNALSGVSLITGGRTPSLRWHPWVGLSEQHYTDWLESGVTIHSICPAPYCSQVTNAYAAVKHEPLAPWAAEDMEGRE